MPDWIHLAATKQGLRRSCGEKFEKEISTCSHTHEGYYVLDLFSKKNTMPVIAAITRINEEERVFYLIVQHLIMSKSISTN